MTRWRGLFLASILIALTVGHLLRDTPGYMVRQDDGSLAGDITHYVYWTRLVTLGGIQSAYSGTWPETYAVYAPVTLLPLELIGTIYQHTQDPNFDPQTAQQSLWLREAIKFAALLWHLLTGIAIFALTRKLAASEKLAALAATTYLVNPATLYDVTHWAQPDGAHALFSVVAVGLLTLGQVPLAWASMAAAAMAKPQAWFLVPLLALATFRDAGARGLGRAAVAGAAIILVVAAPFAVTGHARELIGLPRTISTVMSVVSADAHNFWWLLLQLRGQDPIYLFDSEPAFGPLTYRMLAALLVGASALLSWWLYWSGRAGLAESAALGVLGWFTFTTQAHENHLFFALPLLALAWPRRQWLLAPFALITVSLLMNMLLHDQLVLEALGHSPDDSLVRGLQLINAVLNVVGLGAWAAYEVRPLQRAGLLGYSDHVAMDLRPSTSRD